MFMLIFQRSYVFMVFRNKKASAYLLLSSFLVFSPTQSLVLPGIKKCSNVVFAATSGKYKLTRDPVFGQAVLDTTVANFNSTGFSYGDSVNVTFSNGKTLTDIPYYSSSNTKTGEPLLLSYQGEANPKLAFNNSRSLYDELNLKADDTVVITLNKKGKYLEIENTLKLNHSDRRKDFTSDSQFANFRPLTGGKLKKNKIFRSCSPYDDIYNRAKYTNDLAKANGIDYVINLANSSKSVEELVKKHKLDNCYCSDLFKHNKCICLEMDQNYRSKEYAQKLVKGLKKIIDGGNCLIHCTEGKDRTGYDSSVIEALCGASIEELEEDYMKTYENYYGITKNGTPKRYKAIKELKFDEYVKDLIDKYGKGSNSLAIAAENYLKFGGMKDEEISRLRAVLCKNTAYDYIKEYILESTLFQGITLVGGGSLVALSARYLVPKFWSALKSLYHNYF